MDQCVIFTFNCSHMKWVIVSAKKSLLQEYHLVNSDQCLMVLKYNPLQHSLRISCDGNHKLFFIESTGALTGKYIFRNEYSMETGHMNYDKWFGKEGSVTIETKKFNYNISETSTAELNIYDDSTGAWLMDCELEHIADTRQNSSVENNFLLLGLCWYLCVAKKSLVEYAA